MINTINEIKDNLNNLFATAQGSLDNIATKIEHIADNVGQITFQSATSFIADLTSIGSNIMDMTTNMGRFKEVLGELGPKIAENAKEFANFAMEWGYLALEWGKDAIETVTKQLVDMGKALIDGAKNLANLAIEWVKETAAKVASAIKTAVVTAAQWLWNAAAAVGAVVTKALAAAFVFLTSPIGLVILAIVALIAIGVLLYKNWDTVKEFAGVLWDKVKDIFGKIGDFVGGVFKGIVNGAISMVNMVIKVIETLANAWLTPFNLIIRGLNKIPGVNVPLLKVSLPNIPKLDVGTNFVPSDQLAMIHKGEAVIPKKFNSTEFFSGNNDELLQEVKDLNRNIKSINFSPYISVKDVGDASVRYINNESRIRGEAIINI